MGKDIQQQKRNCLRGLSLNESVSRTCEHIRRNEARNLAELLSELEIIQDLADKYQRKIDRTA